MSGVKSAEEEKAAQEAAVAARQSMTREEFEGWLIERVREDSGWTGLYAGVALSGMFISRAISDLAQAAKGGEFWDHASKAGRK